MVSWRERKKYQVIFLSLLNTIVKAKIEVIREEFEKELSKLKSEYIQKLTETANLL